MKSTEAPIEADPSERFTRRKAELTQRVLDHLLSSAASDTSFRGLAAAAGVTRPTLAHYFGDHGGVLQAAVALAGERGRVWTRLVAEGPEGPPEQILPMMLKWLAMGWGDGLGRLHRIGLLHGLADPAVGAVYRQCIHDPSLAAFAARLQRHQAQGALHVPDPVQAAYALVCPVLMMLLAQHQLGGNQQPNPTDTSAFIEAHVAAFLRAYAP